MLSVFFVFLQVPLLEAGDIIIDGGNSEYRDTTVSHKQSPFRSLSLHVIEDVLTVFLCFCRAAAV